MTAPKKILFKKTGKPAEQTTRDQNSPDSDKKKYHYIPQPPTEPQISQQVTQNQIPKLQQNPPPVKIVAPSVEIPTQPQAPPPKIKEPDIQPPAPKPPSDSSVQGPTPLHKINHKTSTVFESKSTIVKGKPPALSTGDIELFKEQLQNYLELTDALNNPKWTISGIIDALYVLIGSIDLDVVAIGMIDFSANKKLCPIVSRGFREPPNEMVSAVWEKAIGDGPSINWNALMTIAASPKNELSKWIVKEGLDSLGYVPIHDNKTIFGFMFVGTHGKKSPSPLASSILELCGGRLGIVITLRKLQGEWPIKV